MLKRRAFIAGLGGAAAWPVVARGQQNKVWRIGYLHPGLLDTSWDTALFAAFSNQLNALGYVEGKNLIIDKREAEGKNDRLPALANELVALHPNAIVAVATPAIAAARRATAAIPIVMTPATDPVRSGFAKSLAHPGENLTGLAFMGEDLVTKSLEVLHTIVPGAKKIAVLMSSNPTHPPLYDLVNDAAGHMGLSTVAIVAPAANDLDRAFQEITNANCDAVLVVPDVIRPTIVTLASAAKIPVVYSFSEHVDAGGLASYGPNLQSMWKRSAQYVDRIFRGTDPSDFPIEQPTVFEFVLNLKTAKELGLTIPESILARADKVIE